MVKNKLKMTRSGGDDIGNQLYSGAASYGRFMALVSLIIVSIISIILVSISIYLILKKNIYTGSVEGVINTIECQTNTNNKQKTATCNLNVTYIVNNKKYTHDVITSNIHYSKGDNISIKYDQNNPENIQKNRLNNKSIGFIMLGIAAFLMLVVVIYYYVVNKYQFAAAAAGISNVV